MKHVVIAVFLAVVTAGCAGTRVEVEPLLADFDRYERDLNHLGAEAPARDFIATGKKKRNDAQALFDDGKKKDAYPVMKRALADARVALDAENMNRATRSAETCKLHVEQARQSWEEALFVLEQTEGFTGRRMSVSRDAPPSRFRKPDLPAETLNAVQAPAVAAAKIEERWNAWRKAATGLRIGAADLDSDFYYNFSRATKEGAREEARQHFLYLSARVVQSLECRVREHVANEVCIDAAEMASQYANAREEAMKATLDLERGLQDVLRRQLDDVRAEAKSRQDELFDALATIEGKYASVRRDARGTIVSLADILFDFDKATLKRDVEFNLVRVATILNQFSEMGIIIEGHTDSIGTDEYNLDLSKRRAQAVYDFLVSQEVAADRMIWEGYGESRPVADNGTDAGRQKNRRVDLVIQDAP